MSASEFCEAVAAGDNSLVNELLARTDVAIDAKCPEGRLPLAIALRANSVPLVRSLLQHGADVEAVEIEHDPTVTGNTILDGVFVEATHLDEPQKLILLLDAGLSVNYQTRKGWTLLTQAVWNSVAVTRLLLDRGADPNLSGADGWTPLMCAVNIDVGSLRSDDIEGVVQLLRSAGAQSDARNTKGETAEDILKRQITGQGCRQRLLSQFVPETGTQS
jgi:ankyrin repeat protein